MDVERQNVTLSVPKEVLREARVIAARRDTSLSALMTAMLDQLVEEERGYAAARERSLARIEKGFDLGSGGRATATRDELHER